MGGNDEEKLADSPLVGVRVMAPWTDGQLYPGKVSRVTGGGVVTISFDDGDVREGVAWTACTAPEPSIVAAAQCNILTELIMGAVWLGLWLGYGKAENCDKELQWWYLFILGGILGGLVCEVGVIIAAKMESETLFKLCKILYFLDQLFELGVMLWGVALAWGTKSDRIGAGGCKVLATWQKINATAILVLASLVMCMIMTGGGEDPEKTTEMHARQELEERVRVSHRTKTITKEEGGVLYVVDIRPGLSPPPSPFIDPDYQV